MLKSVGNVEHLPLVNYEEDFIPFVAPGEYQLAYVSHQTYQYFARSLKVVVWFRIVSVGPHFGKVIPRYYNVKKLKGKPGKNGLFIPGRSSDFIREYCRLFPEQLTRLDRIPLSAFQSSLIVGKVRTVKSDRKQKELPEPLKYSVIDELLRLEA